MLYNPIAMQLAQLRANTLPAGNYVTRNLMPTIGQSLGAGGLNSDTILPQENNQNVEVPAGSPLVTMNLPKGLSVPQSVDIHLDFMSSAGGSKFNKVVLFDADGYFAAKYGFAGNPAGSVYINSTQENLYKAFVKGMSSSNYHFSGIKVNARASASAGQIYSAESFFDRNIMVHRINAHPEEKSFPIKLTNYEDPYQQNNNLSMIALEGEAKRVDCQTAWVIEIPDGLAITLSFFTLAYTS